MNSDPNVRAQFGRWHSATMDVMANDYEVPQVVEASISKEYSVSREKNTRFWINPKDNLTPWHYDGHGFFVFNVQVRGKKEWKIVSPETPIACYPFGYRGLHIPDAKLLRNKLVFHFITEPGDLLFLPPFWPHKVLSLEDVNININWLATKKNYTALNTAEAKRNKEILKLAYLLKPVDNGHLVSRFMGLGKKKYFENFAGQGWPFVEQIVEDVPFWSAMIRCFKEFRYMPFMAYMYFMHKKRFMS